MIIVQFVGAALVAYLLGSIPFGLFFGRLMGNIDVTEHGSKSIGGTNVIRTVGFKVGLYVIACDLLKGIGAVLLAKLIVGDATLMVYGYTLDWHFAQITAAFMVMIGHNWSVFMKFRGGKGVSAYFGGWLALDPAVAFFGGIIMILAVLFTRYMSLGSMLGSVGIVLLLIILTVMNAFPLTYLFYSLLAAIVIVYQHRDNIIRLYSGKELKFGDKAN
jgi:glycerol-3-phosphate acyltransferase PlsY